MKMSDSDRKKILEAGKFLEELGYEVEIGEYSVIYNNGIIRFDADFERYENVCDLDIKFVEQNKHFIIGWIWVVRNGNQYITTGECADKIIMLMEYLKNNYEKVTDIEWCEESREMINTFFERKKTNET